MAVNIVSPTEQFQSLPMIVRHDCHARGPDHVEYRELVGDIQSLDLSPCRSAESLPQGLGFRYGPRHDFTYSFCRGGLGNNIGAIRDEFIQIKSHVLKITPRRHPISAREHNSSETLLAQPIIEF